tara:strand:- start:499 stop:651 length:153 start_codon:yes stop_codon:yes gene_type:complete
MHFFERDPHMNFLLFFLYLLAFTAVVQAKNLLHRQRAFAYTAHNYSNEGI